jgi:hypothetical protein
MDLIKCFIKNKTRSNQSWNICSIILNLVGSFCMKLWRKLVKVHADLQTLSYTMHSYNFVSRSVEFLIEALQEQVNYREINATSSTQTCIRSSLTISINLWEHFINRNYLNDFVNISIEWFKYGLIGNHVSTGSYDQL